MNTELVKQESHPFTLQAYSQTLTGSLEFAKMLLETKMVPNHFQNPQAVVTAILYGQELGFSPMQALQSVVVIQGTPTLDTNSIKALIIRAGGVMKVIEWNDKVCTLEFSRGNNWVEKYTFTWDDAVKRGLAGKDNWRKMPKAMLYARCVSIGGRNMFADVTKGFYSTDEMIEEGKPSALDITPVSRTTIEYTDSGQAIESRRAVREREFAKTIEISTEAAKVIKDPWSHLIESEKAGKNRGKLLGELGEEWVLKITSDAVNFMKLTEKDRAAVIAAKHDLESSEQSAGRPAFYPDEEERPL